MVNEMLSQKTGDYRYSKGWNATLPNTEVMLYYFRHGSPMNAIQTNDFTRSWNRIGEMETQPTAILCISHWLTQGVTAFTAMQQPKTIHDFGGFPQALFDVQYPASGNKALVEATTDAFIVLKFIMILVGVWIMEHGSVMSCISTSQYSHRTIECRL
jgi:4,5-DOPA dioxygenase extradiol